MDNKLLPIVLDGVPWRSWRRLIGNLEDWVRSGEAQVWKMRSVLPSTSARRYVSIHTGVPPQVHSVTSNETIFRVGPPDIFSEVAKAGGGAAAVAHSFWSASSSARHSIRHTTSSSTKTAGRSIMAASIR